MDLENCEIIQAPEKFTLMSFPIDAMREHCELLKTPKLVHFSSRSPGGFEKIGMIAPIDLENSKIVIIVIE